MGNSESTPQPITESTTQDNDLLDKAETLRCQAHILRSRAKDLSERSQSEYQVGNRSEAKLLSIEKVRLYEEMGEKFRQAAKLIYQHYNQNIQADNSIDLHGLYVHEIFEYLQQKIDQCRSTKISRLTVITGAGNNSPQQIAKIKPGVQAFAQKNRITVTSYSGHLVLDLTEENNNEKKVAAPDANTMCIIM